MKISGTYLNTRLDYPVMQMRRRLPKLYDACGRAADLGQRLAASREKDSKPDDGVLFDLFTEWAPR